MVEMDMIIMIINMVNMDMIIRLIINMIEMDMIIMIVSMVDMDMIIRLQHDGNGYDHADYQYSGNKHNHRADD